MKKTIFGIAALAAIALAGCTKNDVTSVNVPSTDAIHFDMGTSRAAIATIATLEDDLDFGFTVYGTSATQAGWYTDGAANSLDGSIPHVYGSTTPNVWDFRPQVRWAAPGNYPMNFYALWPPDPAGIGTITTTPPASAGEAPVITFSYTVQSTADHQEDLLSGVASADAKPGSATLSLTFQHILSKINFGIITDEGYTSYVQSVGINNVADAGTYDMVSQGAWTGNDTFTASYVYYNGAPTGASQQFQSIVGSTPATPGNPVPFYALPHSEHLMLMPQDPSDNMWNPAMKDGHPIPITPDALAAPTTKSYIWMLYRCQSATDPNFIGYLSAIDHPAYANIDVAHSGYEGPLFVKVGYPYDGAWDKSYGYTYNIQIPGLTGGYLIDQRYYDDHGVPVDLNVGAIDDTNIPIYPQIPQPILTTDEYIHLKPTVATWLDGTVTTDPIR